MNSEAKQQILLCSLAAAACTAAYFLADIALAQYFQGQRDTSLYLAFRFLAQTGRARPYLIAGAIAWLACRWLRPERAPYAGYFVVTVAITGIAALLIKMIFARYRPGLFFDESLYGFFLFHYRSSYLSFPSGHAVTYMAVCGALGRLFPRWFWPLCAAGIVLSFGRVITTQHYLSDVIAGAWLGYAGSALIWHWFFEKDKERAEIVRE